MFRRNTKYWGIPYPFRGHINIKKLFKNMMAGKGIVLDRVSIPEALKILGLTLDGRHHSGVDDAMNIAKILVEVMKSQ